MVQRFKDKPELTYTKKIVFNKVYSGERLLSD